ncbi:MAG TPA: hypothetical protein VN541_09995, partial [Tepidisphaeraceae bacterium]|nr:hypothetical protein [Tepidisphaeraceae bacterium]
AVADSGDVQVVIPVHHPRVRLVSVDGRETPLSSVNGKVTVRLEGDAKMPPPVLMIDQAAQTTQ